MKEMQRIKRLVIQLLKGLPIIIGTFLIGLFIASRVISYSVPKYQSMAKIKLDDRKYGLSGNNLYDDFDVFSSENKIETEAEILKSPLLIGKTVEAMSLSTLVKRVGAIKSTFLYHDNPFLIECAEQEGIILDKKFQLNVLGDGFSVRNESGKFLASGNFGEVFRLEGALMRIDLNEVVLGEKDLTIDGEYEFEIKSEEGWISFLKERLDVKAIDKEISVLRVVVNSEDPYFSADFANKLCEIYVEDYIYTKSLAASKTLNFIDERMKEIKSILSYSENSLEEYKIDNEVVNTLQETETGLRELSRLNVQLINLEMEEEALIALEEYIANGDYYEETAINFGFGDLLMTELVKKLKLYTDEKRDLLVKYTESDERVLTVQAKIDDIEDYIKEALQQNKKNIQLKREELEFNISILSKQFDDIPTREKEMRILERDFEINESVYTFLAQKKLEAQIASSALMSFHRIIQPATVSKDPVSPNKVLITFVCGFLGLLAGVLFVFGRKAFRGKIQSKADLERLTATPVIGVLKKTSNQDQIAKSFSVLSTSLRLSQKDEKQIIVVTSSTRSEGKSYVAENLAASYELMGYNVVYLDTNPFNASCTSDCDFFLEDLLKEPKKVSEILSATSGICRIGLSNHGDLGVMTLAHKNMGELLTEIKALFDYVIVDTPGSVISIDALCMLKYADRCLYIVRSGYSRMQYVPNVDCIQEEYGFNNIQIVLNGAHPTTNYSGNFNGSQLHYKSPSRGVGRLLTMVKTYSK